MSHTLPLLELSISRQPLFQLYKIKIVLLRNQLRLFIRCIKMEIIQNRK